MAKLVNKAGRQVTRRRFSDTPGPIREVYASLVECLENRGEIRSTMIADCRKAGLPEPDFEQRGPHFVVTLWRDWLTETVIDMLKLNDRQKKAIFFIKQNGSITNKQYQKLTKITDRTALRDIKELINKKVLHKIGTTGRATHYVIRNKPDINPTNPT
jgi:ATP-dependent DNA helicase RecG